MAEATHHDMTLAELVRERNNLLTNPPSNGQMMNLAEEGHVFDHEPGYDDYHHTSYHDEYLEHSEHY